MTNRHRHHTGPFPGHTSAPAEPVLGAGPDGLISEGGILLAQLLAEAEEAERNVETVLDETGGAS